MFLFDVKLSFHIFSDVSSFVATFVFSSHDLFWWSKVQTTFEKLFVSNVNILIQLLIANLVLQYLIQLVITAYIVFKSFLSNDEYLQCLWNEPNFNGFLM